MTTTLYYFSGTGNSLKAAYDLAAQLGDAKVVSLAKAMQGNIDTSADRIGIVFPVYMWGLPLIVAEFVNAMPVNKGAYIFAVATYGGMPCGTLVQLADSLKARGMELASGFGVQMPGNYTPLYGAIAEKKQLKMFQKWNKRIAEIAGIVREGKKRPPEKNFFLLNWLFSGILYKKMSPQIPEMDKGFWADDKCIGCGTCAKICPVQNISLEQAAEKKKPAWHGKCEQCLACLQWCPQEAIQVGNKTAGRKRYHHPGITLKDMMA